MPEKALSFTTYEERNRHIEGIALSYLLRVVSDQVFPSSDRLSASITLLNYLKAPSYVVPEEAAAAKVQEHQEAIRNTSSHHSSLLFRQDLETLEKAGY